MEIRFVTRGEGQALALMCQRGPELGAAALAAAAPFGNRLPGMTALYRFTGAEGQIFDAPIASDAPFRRIVFIGIGESEPSPLGHERWAAHAVKRVLATGIESLVLQAESKGVETACHAAIGARL